MAERLKPPQQQPTATGEVGEVFASALSGVLKYWYVFVIIILVTVIIAFVIYLKKRQDEERDPHEDYYKRTMKQCFKGSDRSIEDVFLMTPDGLRKVGDYWGECFTTDGFMNVLYSNLKINKTFFTKWLFKLPFVISQYLYDWQIVRLNKNQQWEEPAKDDRGNVIFNEDGTLKIAKTHKLTSPSYRKNDGIFLISAVDIDRMEFFSYPVLMDEKGNIIDTSYQYYERMSSPLTFDHLVKTTKKYATETAKNLELDKQYLAKRDLNNENVNSEDFNKG